MHELIDTFLDLIETRNFGMTANNLSISQSTVSLRIASLEKKLGVKLFRRGRIGAQPTQAGLKFQDYARSITLSWNMARQELGNSNRIGGIIRIAAQGSLIDHVLLDWVKAIMKAEPGISVHVEADYSTQMINDIVAGNIDVALVYTPRYTPDIVYRPVMTETFYMVSSNPMNVNQLNNENYIRTEYAPEFNKLHSELLPELSQTQLSVGLGHLARSVITQLGGATYLPSHIAQNLVNAYGCYWVDDALTIEQTIFIAYNIRKKHHSVLRKVIELLPAQDEMNSGTT